MRALVVRSASLLFLLALAACGGGGGGGGGAPVNPVVGFDGIVQTIAAAIGGSGDVYIGGSFTSYIGAGVNRIVRLNADGSRDAGFAIGSGFNGDVNSIASPTDGSGDVYVGGDFTTYRGGAVSRIVRINADGSRDAGFDVGTGFDATVLSIAPASDGSGDVYVGGGFNIYRGAVVNGIVRINADGSRDAGFDMGTGFNGPVFSVAAASDGSGDVYVGGTFTVYRGALVNFIVRINADGSRDAGFDVGTGFDGTVFSIAPASDGSGDVYVGGTFTVYRGAVVNGIVRINADGSRDAGFDVGSGFNSGVLSIAPASDGSGDVYVGGNFTVYRGTTVNRIARINADGSRDAGFAIGTGFDTSVQSIAPATDGSGDVYAGGNFTSYRGTVVNGIARLNPDGTLD